MDELIHDQNVAYWLAMQNAPAIGPKRIKSLFNSYGSLKNILRALADSDGPLWWRGLREFLKDIDLSAYQKVINRTYEIGGKICTFDSPEYPVNLRQSDTAPSVLFYKGSLNNLSPRSLALVGTVNPSELGLQRARKFAKLCCENDIQIISGLARGIDTASHTAALDYSGITFAVIGHGIDHCYPPENRELFDRIAQTGAVISQFATGTKPQPWMFPARNETMCTISSGTVIIEAEEKCGSLIQAKHSFRHGRRVFLLNANISPDTEWANELVNRGALTVKDFSIVLKEMAEIKSEFRGLQPEQTVLPLEQISEARSAYIIDDTVKAVLFDLDGVLFDSEAILKRVYTAVCHLMGAGDPDSQILTSKINHAPPYVFKCLRIDHVKGNQLFKKVYLDTVRQYAPFFPGVEEALGKLKENSFKIGIVTSQPLNRYKAIIGRAPFENLIDAAVTWNDLPKDKQKPDPAGILKALDIIRVAPENAAYVGDAKKDIEAAKRASVKAVVVTWGLEPIESLKALSPDLILTEPYQISAIEL